MHKRRVGCATGNSPNSANAAPRREAAKVRSQLLLLYLGVGGASVRRRRFGKPHAQYTLCAS